MSDSGSASDTEGDEAVHAVILDYLAHGHDGGRYGNRPAAFALGTRDFRPFELAVVEDAHVLIGNRIVVEPPEEREVAEAVHEVEYGALSSNAQSELEYVVEDFVDDDEQRFVDFYNDAQPITLRLHQLDLLPGIGKKLRNNILDEREREPFGSFEEIEQRVSGLHNPRDVLVERIIEEIREDDLKYRTFARREGEE